MGERRRPGAASGGPPCSPLKGPCSSPPTGSSSREPPPTPWVRGCGLGKGGVPGERGGVGDPYGGGSWSVIPGNRGWLFLAVVSPGLSMVGQTPRVARGGLALPGAMAGVALTRCCPVPSGGAGGDPVLPHRLADQREEDQHPGPGGSVHPGGVAAALLHIPGETCEGGSSQTCLGRGTARSRSGDSREKGMGAQGEAGQPPSPACARAAPGWVQALPRSMARAVPWPVTPL